MISPIDGMLSVILLLGFLGLMQTVRIILYRVQIERLKRRIAELEGRT